MQQIDQVLPLLSTPRKIVITTHHKPDGDAIGSSLGLYHFLKQCGHFPTVISPSEIPDFLQWMPGIENALNFEGETKTAVRIMEEADLYFCLDFSRMDRVKLLEPYLRNPAKTRILIDHHLHPESEAFEYGICIPEKSSTCEMVYDYIKAFGGEEAWTMEVMQCLYTGLVTDTGSFRFPATTASVHEMAADFKRRNFDHTVIYENVFENDKESRLRLLGFALQERMEIFPEHRLGIITLSKADLERFNVITGDTEGIVNYPLSLANVKVSVLLIERKDEIKLSFRSKGQIDVSAFARKHFNGGGHFNAAGGSSNDSMENTVAALKSLIFNGLI